MKLDTNLRAYATDRQWEVLEALAEHGTERKAAKALGINRSTVNRYVHAVLKRAAQSGYAPDYGIIHRAAPGMTVKGTSIRYNAQGGIEQYWNKTRQEGRDPEEAVQLPDPKRIAKLSTLYDNQGKVVQQWVSERPEEAAREALWRSFAEALIEEIPRAGPIRAPFVSADSLMAVYPVGDHHHGLYVNREEGMGDYDLEIGEALLRGAIEHLVRVTPSCAQAAVVFLGDYLHFDSMEPVTPTHRNLLDASARYPQVVKVAIRSMRHLIDTALAHHRQVHVVIEIGNHDLATSVFLAQCMEALYEEEPRVTIDTSPRHYHYFSFGKNLIGTHHGHGVKMEKLPLIMATDQPELWGRTKHRLWLTGHVHHDQRKDFEGCTVESFRVLPPQDAYATQKGFRSARDMKAIVLHEEHGEVARHIVNPDMLDVA